MNNVKKTGHNKATARWITVLGSAAIGLAIWAAVVNSPSATQSAQVAAAPAASSFSLSDTFLTQPSLQPSSVSTPGTSAKTVSAQSTARLRTRAS